MPPSSDAVTLAEACAAAIHPRQLVRVKSTDWWGRPRHADHQGPLQRCVGWTARLLYAKALSLRVLRYTRRPSKPKPRAIIAQVDGSGTEGAKAVMVALPVLNPAVKKPDENRVAFVSITNAAVSESLGTPSKKLKPTVPAVGRSTVLGGDPGKIQEVTHVRFEARER